ncbi:MAG: hypothetical protein R2839_07950 [Thermomicrobiales bacterium]
MSIRSKQRQSIRRRDRQHVHVDLPGAGAFLHRVGIAADRADFQHAGRREADRDGDFAGSRYAQLSADPAVHLRGAGYALIAGLVGALLGAAVSVGIANVMQWLFGDYVTIEPHVEPRSIVLAYSMGVLITFLTIVVSARRVSKLNVVAAIRDIPEFGTGNDDSARWCSAC